MPPAEEMTTVILDAADGTVLGHHPEMGTIRGPGGAWVGEHELLLYDEYAEGDEPWMVEDPYNGRSRGPDRGPGALMGIVGDRAVRYVHLKPHFTHFATTDLDGGDQRPFITVHPGRLHGAFDLAPSALLELWAAARSR